MGQKLKILHIVSALASGGVEQFLLNVYQNMDRDQVEFSFITHRPPGLCEERLSRMGCRIFHVTARKAHPLRACAETYQIMKALRFDQVFLHGGIETIPQLIVSRICGIPVRVCYIHGYVASPSPPQRLVNSLTKSVKGLLATHSLACSECAAGWGGVRGKETKIIHNGIDVAAYVFREDVRREYRKKFHWEDQYVIGLIGRLSDVKNHKFMLRVLKSYVKKDPSAILILVGEGERESAIRKEISSLKLEDRVQLLGRRRDVPNLMQAFDTLVLPSKNEGLGIVLVEGQAAGLPCLASDRVAKDAKISGFLTFLSIDDGTDCWVKALWEAKDIGRLDQGESIERAGYEIREEAEKLQKLIFEINGEKPL